MTPITSSVGESTANGTSSAGVGSTGLSHLPVGLAALLGAIVPDRAALPEGPASGGIGVSSVAPERPSGYLQPSALNQSAFRKLWSATLAAQSGEVAIRPAGISAISTGDAALSVPGHQMENTLQSVSTQLASIQPPSILANLQPQLGAPTTQPAASLPLVTVPPALPALHLTSRLTPLSASLSTVSVDKLAGSVEHLRSSRLKTANETLPQVSGVQPPIVPIVIPLPAIHPVAVSSPDPALASGRASAVESATGIYVPSSELAGLSTGTFANVSTGSLPDSKTGSVANNGIGETLPGGIAGFVATIPSSVSTLANNLPITGLAADQIEARSAVLAPDLSAAGASAAASLTAERPMAAKALSANRLSAVSLGAASDSLVSGPASGVLNAAGTVSASSPAASVSQAHAQGLVAGSLPAPGSAALQSVDPSFDPVSNPSLDPSMNPAQVAPATAPAGAAVAAASSLPGSLNPLNPLNSEGEAILFGGRVFRSGGPSVPSEHGVVSDAGNGMATLSVAMHGMHAGTSSAGAALGGVASSGAPSTPIQASNPFHAMDSVSARSVDLGGLSAARGQGLAVGYQDPALGYVELRAHQAAGAVHAELVTSSAASGHLLEAHLGSMDNWLRERQTPVESLSVIAQGADRSLGGGASHSFGGNAGQHTSENGGEAAPLLAASLSVASLPGASSTGAAGDSTWGRAQTAPMAAKGSVFESVSAGAAHVGAQSGAGPQRGLESHISVLA